MEEETSKEKRKETDLEKRLYTIEDLPEQKEHVLYMPDATKEENRGLWEKVKDYAEQMKPKDFRDWMYLSNPTFHPAYVIWKLPSEMHEYLNKLLKYATEISAVVAPEATPELGLAYGVSQVVYGIKTRSGKHTGAGLTRLVSDLKKVSKNEKLNKFLQTAEEIIEKYFHKFNPKHAKAHANA